MKVSSERLEQITERAKAATKAPWASPGNKWTAIQDDAIEPSAYYWLCSKQDAEFIANARQDVPDLVEDLKEERARSQQLEDALSAFMCWTPTKEWPWATGMEPPELRRLLRRWVVSENGKSRSSDSRRA